MNESKTGGLKSLARAELVAKGAPLSHKKRFQEISDYLIAHPDRAVEISAKEYHALRVSKAFMMLRPSKRGEQYYAVLRD